MQLGRFEFVAAEEGPHKVAPGRIELRRQPALRCCQRNARLGRPADWNDAKYQCEQRKNANFTKDDPPSCDELLHCRQVSLSASAFRTSLSGHHRGERPQAERSC